MPMRSGSQTRRSPLTSRTTGSSRFLDDQTRSQVRALIEKAAQSEAANGTPAQKVGDLYNSVLDTFRRNKDGIAPIKELLGAIADVDSRSDLAKTIGMLRRSGVGAPVVSFVNVDARKSDQYTVYLTQAGISLPDRDYYLEDDPRYIKLREELEVYIADMLKEVGHEAPSAAAKTDRGNRNRNREATLDEDGKPRPCQNL